MHLWRQWPAPEVAVLIDVDVERTHWAKALVAEQADWHLIDGTLLDQADAEAMYYRASNPTEDGLLDPQALSPLWPNLHALGQQQRPATRLDTLLDGLDLGAKFQAPSQIWLLLDCLPAARILRGASGLLQHAAVVCARVLLEPPEGAPEEATLAAVEAELLPLGYRCVQLTESNHPAVGEALFARAWDIHLRPQLQQASQQQQQAEAKTKELTQALESARAEAEKQAQQATQHKAEAEKQAKLAAERAQQLSEREQAYAALARDNAIALRLQTLREADLKDLQQRYAQVIAQKNQQESLLKQLTERLTAASGYLRQLEQDAEDRPQQLAKPSHKRSKQSHKNSKKHRA